jgi:Protein of unknown function (DUF3025)
MKFNSAHAKRLSGCRSEPSPRLLIRGHGPLLHRDSCLIRDEQDYLAAFNQQANIQALTNHRDIPLRFVAQAELPAGMAYEAFISGTGQIPTRHNLHDYFNALVWLNFPNIKRQLNALQAAQIETHGVGQSRGRTRDAATIFDENCALLVVSETRGQELLEDLRAHRWQRAWLEQRHLYGTHVGVWLFGHALMEKLVTPYKSITAHAWPVIVTEDFFTLSHGLQRQQLDATVADDLQHRVPTTTRFTPLPVLGVPGWWPDQDAQFYADTDVFRPKPTRR